MNRLPSGLHDRLIDEELCSILKGVSKDSYQLKHLDPSNLPHRLSQWVARLLEHALESDPNGAVENLVNPLIEQLTSRSGDEHLLRHKLVRQEHLLLESVGLGPDNMKPVTSLSTSSLLTGKREDPTLEHEIRAEMTSADDVRILISFIKWSGLRLLMPAFEQLEERKVPVRIITTSYMGASEPEALAWLAQRSNIEMRVSFDTTRTRLHAKAYLFHRESGCSTAYIGSANMGYAAMTHGLEWTLKVTRQDLPHILNRFKAEFDTYWEDEAFEPFTVEDVDRFRVAIQSNQDHSTPLRFLAEVRPRPYQQRILEALEASRLAGSSRNLIVAATGTGKTVIAALDYRRTCEASDGPVSLLFVAHRKEILEQALDCFKTVLRDQNFGELYVEGRVPTTDQHIFASIQTLARNPEWLTQRNPEHFSFIIVDEAHHGKAGSYRPLLGATKPKILLGLTATPERMDGSNILEDFDHRFAAEIRLPEALEEKLLCPFHYFGVSDNIDLSSERFWKNGKYAIDELEKVFTGDDIRARQRVDLIREGILRYQPQTKNIRCVGFCSGRRHAQYMAKAFSEFGWSAEVILGDTEKAERKQSLEAFRRGEIKFLFTVDVLSEGVDIPDINMVLFLRPTESLTVFLQQLGRGLRHAHDKDCLTILDFIGQYHRNYRIDLKLSALLGKKRSRIDLEIQDDFPSLPAGCSIQMERVAKERVISMVKRVINQMNTFIPEALKTWEPAELSFESFIEGTGLHPLRVLSSKTWSQWKALAQIKPPVEDPDLKATLKFVQRLAQRDDPELLNAFLSLIDSVDTQSENNDESLLTAMHYMIWGTSGPKISLKSLSESITRLKQNPNLLSDIKEIVEWRLSKHDHPIREIQLPYPCWLKLHAQYGTDEIKAAVGLCNFKKSGPTGVGVMHNRKLKTYIHLVTFNKEEKDFSPTTRYRDYPLSRKRLHWESQSTTSQKTETGQNYINFKERDYSVLFFARMSKKNENITSPFIFLGPAKELLGYEGNQPISMTWELEYPMPAGLFEEAKSA